MPIAFKVDRDARLVRSIATGIVSLTDIKQHMREKGALDLSEFSELFIAIDIQLDISSGDLPAIATADRKFFHGKRRVAVVTNSFYLLAMATAYQGLTKENNPEFRVFKTEGGAREWLEQDALHPQ